MDASFPVLGNTAYCSIFFTVCTVVQNYWYHPALFVAMSFVQKRWQIHEALEAQLQQLFAHRSRVRSGRYRTPSWRPTSVDRGHSEVLSVVDHVDWWTLRSTCRIVEWRIFRVCCQRLTQAGASQTTQLRIPRGKSLLCFVCCISKQHVRISCLLSYAKGPVRAPGL